MIKVVKTNPKAFKELYRAKYFCPMNSYLALVNSDHVERGNFNTSNESIVKSFPLITNLSGRATINGPITMGR